MRDLLNHSTTDCASRVNIFPHAEKVLAAGAKIQLRQLRRAIEVVTANIVAAELQFISYLNFGTTAKSIHY